MAILTITGDADALREILTLLTGRPGIEAVTLNEHDVTHHGITIRPGDPTVDISDVPGVWADRHELTADSLRRKAWGYRRRNPFDKARGHLLDARARLRQAGQQEGFYQNPKLSKRACRTAWLGVLTAANAYLDRHAVTRPEARPHPTWYLEALRAVGWQRLTEFDSAYKTVLLSGGYDGTTLVEIIAHGLALADELIAAFEAAASGDGAVASG